MAFGITAFSETSFCSLPSNIYLNATGQQANTSLGNISISANGAITIQTGPEIALDVNLGTITIGLATFLDITGQELNISQGEEIIVASATTDITGQLANTAVNSITVGEGGSAVINGQQLNSNLGTVSVAGNGIIIANGIEINVNEATLRFWDPIVDGNTETWTNI